MTRAAYIQDFERLHNIAKHLIHLTESSEAMLENVKSVLSNHEELVEYFINQKDRVGTSEGSSLGSKGRVSGTPRKEASDTS